MRKQNAPSVLEIRRHMLDVACRHEPLQRLSHKSEEAIAKLSWQLRSLNDTDCLAAAGTCQGIVKSMSEGRFKTKADDVNNDDLQKLLK